MEDDSKLVPQDLIGFRSPAPEALCHRDIHTFMMSHYSFHNLSYPCLLACFVDVTMNTQVLSKQGTVSQDTRLKLNEVAKLEGNHLSSSCVDGVFK